MSDADDKLRFATLAIQRELPSDNVELAPAIQPGLVAYGSLDTALSTLRLALSELPDEARPQTVARYLLPAGVRVELVETELAIPGTTGRLARPHPVVLPVVLVPEPRRESPVPAGYWAFLPTLDHACFVERAAAGGPELAARIADEVAVLPEAYAFGLEHWRRLFQVGPVELVDLAIELATTPLAVAQGKKALAQAERMRLALATLDGAGRRVERQPTWMPLVGRDEVSADLVRLLDDRERRSVLLVGEEAAGKSALVLAFAQREGRRPIWSTSVGELVAGASGLGEWQARVAAVLEAAELVDAILYFDDFGALFADRPAEGGIDLGAAIRRHVVDARVRVVGELTPNALDRAERRDVSLIGAMHRLAVPPTDDRTTIAIGRAWALRWRQTQAARPQLTDAAVVAAVELARRFLPYRAFPGKAIRLLEELRVTHDRGRDATGAGPELGPDELHAAFAAATGIPIALLSDAAALSPASVTRALRARMIGQDAAVARVADAICVAKARLQPADKPLAALLFVGPTGTGKTELARSVAAYLFGAPDRMVRLDMSEYTDPYAAERLFGGGDDEGRLTAAVRSQPFGVVLLDEIEKAHPSVFDLLLQVLGEARLTDGRGRTTYFHNAIVVLTSNLGTRGARGRLGIELERVAEREREERRYRDAVLGAFRPELVNRLDQIVVFHPLAPDEIARITEIAVGRLAERRGFTQAGVLLDISPRALEVIAERGFSADLGARALRRYIDAAVLGPIARLLAAHGGDAHGGTVAIHADDEPRAEAKAGNKLGEVIADGLAIALGRRGAATGRRLVRSALALGGLRRDCDRELAHASVAAVHDRVSELEATLATESRRREGKRALSGTELARLTAEHARLTALVEACTEPANELRTAEELCLEALAQDVDAVDLIDGALAHRQAFRRALFWLVVALRPHGSGATVLVHAPGHRAGLVAEVAMMLEAAEALGFRATAHVYGEIAPGWRHAWGPPHGAPWVRDHLAGASSAALVRIEGRGADLLFGLEAGLHRFVGLTTDACHCHVDLLETRVDFSDAEWAALPPPPLPRPPRGAPMRTVTLPDTIAIAGDELAIAWADAPARLPELAIVRVLAAGDDDDGGEPLWQWEHPIAATLAAQTDGARGKS